MGLTDGPGSARTDVDPIVCKCLRITECQVLSALASRDGVGIRTVRDLQRTTGAGGGCTACHDVLQRYLDVRDRVTCPTADCSPDGIRTGIT